ncbi:MAG: alpha/beta fold hydrolase [Spirochaetota bacterium]
MNFSINLVDLFATDPSQQRHLERLFQQLAPASGAGHPAAEPKPKPEERYVPVKDGSIRVLHYVPGECAHPSSPRGTPASRRQEHRIGRRPIIFLPGWGTIPAGFTEFLNVVSGQAECYYVETREKNSSRLDRSRARMDMDQLAEDVQAVMNIAGPNSVLMGTCWGSTIIAHGLARGIITAETVVLFDPMHTLWFPKWLLNWVVPVVPLYLWKLVKPIGKRIALWGMKEPVQRARAELFIDNADLRKWKSTALQVQDVNLYEEMPKIRQEVLVMNGVKDKIHDRRHYPELAAMAPQGRFFYLPVDEALRERLLGIVAVLCAVEGCQDNRSGLPQALLQFERNLSWRS